MNQFQIVLAAVLPVFCIAGAGILLRRLNWLTEAADQSLLRLTVNFLQPVLIFDSILKNQALKQADNVILPPLVGFLAVGMGLGVGRLLGRCFGMKDRKMLCTLAICIGIFNYGYVPVPLVQSLFGETVGGVFRCETLGVLFVHNVGVEIAFWTIGVATLGASAKRSWKSYFNPPVIAILVSLPLNYVNAHQFLPQFVLEAARMVGACAVPIGILLIGAMMADYLSKFHSAAGWRAIVAACVLRMGVMPVLFLLLAKYLPCSDELKRVIVIQGAMPTATFTVILARHYGGDTSTAVRALISTSALGLLTIPLWIRFGMRFAGLE